MSILLLVTMVSVAVACAACVVAWRTWTLERRRLNARVAVLAAEIGREDEQPHPALTRDLLAAGASREKSGGWAPTAGILSGTASGTASFQAFPPGVIGILAATAAVAAVLTLSFARIGGAFSDDEQPAPLWSVPPLELLALEHEQGPRDIVVRGTVRNPTSSPRSLDHVAVGVLLLDAAGLEVATGRAGLARETLPPGADARFEVAVSGPEGAVRYRVGFSTASGVVPHVDRRPAGNHVVAAIGTR